MDMLEKAAANPEKLDLTGLNYYELTEVKKTLETEINVLSNSFDQLRLAATKFAAGKEKLTVFTPEAKNKEILVPLTTSVFIPGTLENVDRVMFEVGVGYFVEESIPKATAFFDRKIEDLKKNMTYLSKIIENKSKQREDVLLCLQEIIIKLQQQQAQAQAQGQGQAPTPAPIQSK